MNDKDKTFIRLAILLWILTLVLALFVTVYSDPAKASYDSFKVQCETLQGAGYVMVYVNDETYRIPIECK